MSSNTYVERINSPYLSHTVNYSENVLSLMCIEHEHRTKERKEKKVDDFHRWLLNKNSINYFCHSKIIIFSTLTSRCTSIWSNERETRRGEKRDIYLYVWNGHRPSINDRLALFIKKREEFTSVRLFLLSKENKLFDLFWSSWKKFDSCDITELLIDSFYDRCIRSWYKIIRRRENEGPYTSAFLSLPFGDSEEKKRIDMGHQSSRESSKLYKYKYTYTSK